MKVRKTVVPALVAAAVMALVAGGAFAGVAKHDSKLTISRFVPLYHGKVQSDFAKCKRGRRVALYEKRPGRDRKVGSDRTNKRGNWKVKVPVSQLQPNDRFYAKVRRKLNIVSGNGYVCRADRSRTIAFVGD